MIERRWSPLDASTYRIVWNGRAWLLRTTGGKYPWLLVAGDGSDSQEIGAREVSAAQRVAAMWLDISSTGIYPRESW